jgi:carbohydrate diacid regulator
MMSILTKDQASLIVHKLMDDIPYNINIMDNKGRIIASGDDSRIGSPHMAAERAIREKRMVIVNEDTPFEKCGTNEPIIYQEEIIGVVGISGEPAEVQPFTKLVKTIALMLIEDLDLYKKQEESNLAKEEFLHQLGEPVETYNTSIQKTAREKYHLFLGEKYYCIASSKESFLKRNYPGQEVFRFGKNFLCFSNKLSVENRLKTDTMIVVSQVHHHLHKAIAELANTLKFLEFLTYKPDIYQTSDFYFANIMNFNLPPSRFLLEKLVNALEFLPTLLIFVKNNSNINKTADELHIHRNTLNYRLNKLEQISGKNPHNAFELLELIYHFAYLTRTKENE